MKNIEFNDGRGNVSYAQNESTLYIKIDLDGKRVQSQNSGNWFVASGPVKAKLANGTFANAWLNLNLPKPSKKDVMSERDALAAKVAELEAQLTK